jgi:hypothetical protein
MKSINKDEKNVPAMEFGLRNYLNTRVNIIYDDRDKASSKKGMLLSVSDVFVIINIEDTGFPEAYPVSRIIRMILLGGSNG